MPWPLSWHGVEMALTRYIINWEKGLRILGQHPVTFESELEHPILDISSSYSTLRQPITDWFATKQIDYKFGFDGKGYYIDFYNQQDVALFVLTWDS